MQSTTEAITSKSQDLLQVIKTLSRVHTLTSVYHIGEVWAVIVMMLYVSAVLVPLSSGIGGAVAYLFAVMIIASRQHALMVLTHEGIHKRLSRTLEINDWLARLLTSFPVLISLSKWRFIHLCHHQFTHTVDDPDRAIYARYPMTSWKFRRLLLRDLCGLNVISTLKYFIDIPFVTEDFNKRFLGEDRDVQYQQLADIRQFLLFWLIILSGGVLIGGTTFVFLFVCYWLAPYCTFTQVFFRIRGAIEHGNVPDPSNAYRQTRTYLIHPIVAIFFSPKKVN
jgi:fatty acid desaturase